MNLGLFMMPVHPPGKLVAQCYDEDIEAIALADEVGYAEAWIGEHATMQWENIPAPDQFIARVFPETKQIRFGTGVVLMSQHHPANTANRIAQLDHLTRGRLNFGIGLSGVATDLELFAIDGASGLPGIMMMRAIDLILKFWTEDPPYDFPGQFWPVRVRDPRPEVGIGPLLKPFQKPYPPIAVPGVSASSRLLYTCGQRGWMPLSSNFTHARLLRSQWDQVARGAESAERTADRSTWRIAREVYVAETTEEARAFARRSSIAQAFDDYFFKLLRPSGRLELFKASDETPTSDVTVDYLLDNVWLVGSPDDVARQIVELHEQVGGFGTLLMVPHDWDEPDRWRSSMRLLATEVMPRVAHLGVPEVAIT
ncbi:MAG TPA: LLM class flavin-dependent oxidoreductase [Chloroflexota bacterium]|nr:LLM class flavin-dependent oxidoreductase [Chloroflexota bacterium]